MEKARQINDGPIFIPLWVFLKSQNQRGHAQLNNRHHTNFVPPLFLETLELSPNHNLFHKKQYKNNQDLLLQIFSFNYSLLMDKYRCKSPLSRLHLLTLFHRMFLWQNIQKPMYIFLLNPKNFSHNILNHLRLDYYYHT